MTSSSGVTGTGCLQKSRKKYNSGGASHSYRPNTASPMPPSRMGAGNAGVASQDTTSGRHPSRRGSMYTMPHRLTVAGLASSKSSVSYIMVVRPDILMISPLFRHSFLLSSSTVFMLSIHSVSTGPSNNTHLRSGVASLEHTRMMLASTPSCHSCVLGSNCPYSWPMVMLLGFR